MFNSDNPLQDAPHRKPQKKITPQRLKNIGLYYLQRFESSVENLVKLFNKKEELVLAITPEGTRSLTNKWRSGFLNIALMANVPIQIAVIDFKEKTARINNVFYPTGDIEADLRCIKDFYKNASGKYPEKFTVE